ncbi:MAG: glycoside hydrolase family 31 protein [Firmicutes bacterium]|nr:glycoside hydrolase family 31 protein [Bacillota bacterium]
MEIKHNEAITTGGLRVSMPIPGIIRVTDGNHKGSYMVSAKARKSPPKVTGDRLIWGKITVEPENGMALSYDGRLLCSDYPGPRRPRTSLSPEEVEQLRSEGHLPPQCMPNADVWPVEVVKSLAPDAVVYGLGDKTGFLNKRHYAYENWNSDDPSPHCDNFQSLYKSISFFMVYSENGCLGILTDNSYRTRFDFGKEQEDYYFWSHAGGALDYYMIPGKNPKEVLKRYLALTGKSSLQQKWVYGFHQSRWSYFTEREVLDTVNTMRKNKLPLDAIHMDIDYMEGFRVFTFDHNRFPNPKGLTEKLAAQNVKPVTIIDPGVKIDSGYFVYDEGIEQGHFAKNPDGTVYEGEVWPGPAVFPDFTQEKTRRWWGDKLKIMTDVGIRGIWNDMNEPANFTGQLPDDVRFSTGSHDEIHNVYGHLMAEATYDGLRKADNRRPFVLTRACCAGSQRFCSGWTGDNHSLWAHMQLSLTQMMNLGLSGMYMVGSDVGGFGSDTTPELLIRWFQLGAISPFFRDHYAKGTRNQEPYAFDRATMDACREALDLRYHLLPYLYDLAHEDMPILRPLVLEFPEDPICRELTDQCMLGDRLLAAPVMTPGVAARAVYLPKGVWFDYYTGKRYSGGRYVLAEAPLDRMPLFARGGAVIPVSVGKPQSVEDIREVVLEVFPGNGRFVHYMDDGETMAYLDGELRALQVSVRGRRTQQKIIAAGYPGPESLRIQWMA